MKIFKEMGSLALSDISLNQFYGIELDDFASEIARVALWLSKHQMSVNFLSNLEEINLHYHLVSQEIGFQSTAQFGFGRCMSKNENDEIYILGNPPFYGKGATKNQKMKLNLYFKTYQGMEY